MIEKTLPIDRMENVISVFGSFDQNLRIIESELGVRVTDRDDQLRISGEAEDVMAAEKAINGLLQLASRGEAIDAQNVRYILKLVGEGREAKIGELSGDVVCITAKGKPIKAKTLGQKAYVDAMAQNTITLGIGPAGTGKTYLAVAMAVAAFRSEKVNRIILTRPAVEAGERLGFLPGDLQSKVDPYLRPLYDALFEMLGPETYNKYLNAHRLRLACGHHRRRDADRPAAGQGERAEGGHARAQGHRRHRHLPPDRGGRGAPRAGAEDHRSL